MDRDVFASMDEARRDGRTVVMGTTVRTDGDPPSAPGNRALFAPDGALLAGTIGCNGLDRKAGRDGARLVAAGERSGIRAYTSFEGEPGEGADASVVLRAELAWAGEVRKIEGCGNGPIDAFIHALAGATGHSIRV
ncbi:MAG TPA: XdhC family protein, partial [Actinomycetota bacterium]|nr:XdhC family protein [Actinomycetota bacterium]